jgi:hypothetical protein
MNFRFDDDELNIIKDLFENNEENLIFEENDEVNNEENLIFEENDELNDNDENKIEVPKKFLLELYKIDSNKKIFKNFSINCPINLFEKNDNQTNNLTEEQNNLNNLTQQTNNLAEKTNNLNVDISNNTINNEEIINNNSNNIINSNNNNFNNITENIESPNIDFSKKCGENFSKLLEQKGIKIVFNKNEVFFNMKEYEPVKNELNKRRKLNKILSIVEKNGNFLFNLKKY